MFHKKFILLLLCAMVMQHLFAQHGHYIIYFKDKGNCNTYQATDFLSKKAISRRVKQNIAINLNDYPVYKDYLKKLRQAGIQIGLSSKWLNAVSASLNEEQLKKIRSFYFIKKIEALHELEVKSGITSIADSTIDTNYRFKSDNQLHMLALDTLHAHGFTGKGMTIAVFDNGFNNIDTMTCLKHVFTNKQILASRNFVHDSLNAFVPDGDHGQRVISILAARVPGFYSGSAPDANFILGVTEDNSKEGELEEYNWLAAAEWADSIGTDIISSSLGYFDGFTYGTSHTYADMNGHTTVITKAANMAASKGILVITAAGNEGGHPWQYIIAPGDADSNLTVGAVDSAGNYAVFSSTGPTADGRIKPEVAAQGQKTVHISSEGKIIAGNGTSFATPLISGMAACIWQSDTLFKSMELFYAIKESASMAANPNNYYGWGIPNATKVHRNTTKGINELMPGSFHIYPNPAKDLIYIESFKPLNKNTTIYMYDLHGKEILHTKYEKMNQVFSIDISALLPALYVLMIKDEDGQLLYRDKIISLK